MPHYGTLLSNFISLMVALFVLSLMENLLKHMFHENHYLYIIILPCKIFPRKVRYKLVENKNYLYLRSIK